MNSQWTRYLPSFFQKKLEGREAARQALDNAGWMLGNNVFRQGVSLVVGVWVARYLGPKQYGLMNYAGAVIYIFFVLGKLGLSNIVVRDLAKHPSEAPAIMGSTFLLRIVGSCLAFAASVGAVALLRPGDRLALMVVVVMAGGTMFQAADVLEMWFQAQVRSRSVVFATALPFLGSSVAKIALVLSKMSLLAFAWVGSIEGACSAVGLVWAYARQGGRVSNWRVSAPTIASIWKDSWPLFVAGITAMISLRIDQLLVGWMVGDGELGLYAVAVRMTEVCYFLPYAIQASAFPALVQLRTADYERFLRRLQQFLNVLVFTGYGVALIITVSAQWVVPFLFGESFRSAGLMLQVLVWTVVSVGLGTVRATYLVALNRTRLVVVLSIIGAVANVVLNLWLIPRYGALGAAIASCISYWVTAHGSCYLFPSLRPIGRMMTKALLCPKFW